MSQLPSLPLDRISGLCPQIWLVVGAGFAREDVKALILSQGRGFVGDAVLNPQELYAKLTGVSSEKILSPFARQEVIRTLLAEPKILASLPELRHLKRKRDFIQRLDLALQTGRMAFAHSEEERVFQERLIQSFGENPLRDQLRGFALAYEAWLTAVSCWDQPMLVRQAIQTLQGGWPEGLRQPEEIWFLSPQSSESLEREFWEVLGQSVSVKRISTLVGESQSGHPKPRNLAWEKWHTLDDAAEYLAETLGAELAEGQNPGDDPAVLIPDIPSIRRSLRRALDSRQLHFADPRDPTQLLWDENYKWAVLPLEVVARNFERQKVLSWLRGYRLESEFPTWAQEINGRGIRQGLSAYSGGVLEPVHSYLKELEGLFGGRQTCQEISETFLKHLRSNLGNDSSRFDLVSFFEQTWKILAGDLERVDAVQKKAPALYWLERLQSRMGESSPPVEKLKPQGGVRLYRLQQAPVIPARKLWIFGLPSHWLNGDGAGSLWFSERDREVLAYEFAVRSSAQVRAERVAILKDWISSAEEVVFLDSCYTSEGREVESIFPILQELEVTLGESFPRTSQERGSHRRFSKSYSVTRPLPPQKIQLPSLGVPATLTATTLDRYSRCSFLALTYHRWGLRDVREPDSELWPEVRGNILHEALRLLMRSVQTEGCFTLLPREAMERAWKSVYPAGPKGLIRSPRIVSYVKSRMVTLLEIFMEKEREYLKKSGVAPASLDDTQVALNFDDVSIIGKPDRVDRHRDGLFIIDYKTSGTVAHGTEMLERGYRLQLPFYALAIRREAREAVLGVQFVELDRRGSRKSGVLFQSHNGKEDGHLTQLRSTSKSLISMPSEDAWDLLEEQVHQKAKSFVNGEFEAMPNVPRRVQECSQCRVSDLCGYRRWIEPDPVGEAGSSLEGAGSSDV